MSWDRKIVTVFGGTGFIGRNIVQRLAKAGYTVKVATRAPERAYFLRPCGTVGQIVPFACDYKDPRSIAAAVEGANAVINCVGVIYQKGKNTFQKIHVDLAGAIAAASTDAGVGQLVHISALGCDSGKSKYALTKKAGEDAVRGRFPGAVILRPSIVFGPEDEFFNMFARLAQISPVLPLIGGGATRFQPVYVGDIADAVMAALSNPGAAGKIFELGGPEVVDFKEIYQRLFAVTGQRRCLMNLPFGLARIKASFLCLLPHPPLTPDQVESLKTDSVVSGRAFTLRDLGVTPTGMTLILPAYLGLYKKYA